VGDKETFIIDCPTCKAKVGAVVQGEVSRGGSSGYDEDDLEPWEERIRIGKCPKCDGFLVGESKQLEFAGFTAEFDLWSDDVRVYPKPAKTFLSTRMPKALTESLIQADRCLQANANIAACVMFGRALESLCRDHLEDKSTPADPNVKKKTIMLGKGIQQLRSQNIIDDRLYDWSQQLQVFRNLAAHPDDDFNPSREDTEDLQAFVYAIAEYVYDLTDRYNDFKARMAKREKLKPASPDFEDDVSD
jgi:hypothetical protein